MNVKPKEPQTKRGRTESDDVESSSNDIIALLQGLNSKMDVLTSTVSENSLAIKNIDARLTAKIDNLESSVAESINKVKVEVDSRISDITADINQRLNNLAAATHSSCQENSKDIQTSTSNLVNIQHGNEHRFNKLEREVLRNELIVTGIPAAYGEAVIDIIGDICNALQCNINGGDVIAAYRLPAGNAKSGRPRNERLSAPIVLKLGSDWAKQHLLSAYFKKKNLNIGDIGYQSKARIYVNESLTLHNRAIFKAASEAKKSKLITKCYTRNGIVHVQTSEEGRIFRINDIDQLNAIISPSQSNLQTHGSTYNSSNQTATLKTINSTTVQQDPITTKPGVTLTVHDGEPMEENKV